MGSVEIQEHPSNRGTVFQGYSQVLFSQGRRWIRLRITKLEIFCHKISSKGGEVMNENFGDGFVPAISFNFSVCLN